ncbi:MAG: hypothetical protein ABJH52_11305 [Henriciella sp.]
MSETLEQIPPEAWPLIELLLNITMVSAAIWLAVTVFIWWRRSASNLTPVNAAQKNANAQPDFLSVDHKARAEAVERGEKFDDKLEKQERAAAKAAARGGRTRTNLVQKLAGFISLFMSLFALGSMISSAIWQVSRMGGMMKDYSTFESLSKIITEHPISVSVAALVIGVHIYQFLSNRQWKED